MAHTFTPEESALGGQRGAATRHQQTLERTTRAYRIANLVDQVDQGSIGQSALETAFDAILRLEQELPSVPVNDTLDVYRLGQVADALFKIHRLATGQSTSNAAHATVDPVELQARLSALQATELPGTDTPAS